MDSKPFDHAFKVKDSPELMETLVDGVQFMTIQGQTARFIFTVSRPDEPKPGHKGPPTGQKIVAARLAMPLPAFADLYNKIEQMVRGLETQGLLTRSGSSGVKPTVQ